uniref:Metalloendopeptidase n=1 Tax=Romanomermis culicivorax TaxID=13658 RepID=A0A915KIH5_ROMCU
MVYHNGQRRVKRAATARKERIWDDGVIPYEIQSNFSGEHQALFRRAMNHWENHTCITFVPRKPTDDNYILFTVAECGHTRPDRDSYVDIFYRNIQESSDIILSENQLETLFAQGESHNFTTTTNNNTNFGVGGENDTLSSIMEILNLLNVTEENSTIPDINNRPISSDQNETVVEEEGEERQDYNFEKLKGTEVNSLGQPYDYNSIMHYAKDTFARAMYLDTILPKPDKLTKERPEIGQRIRLSSGDIAQTNALYKCSGKKTSLSQFSEQNKS